MSGFDLSEIAQEKDRSDLREIDKVVERLAERRVIVIKVEGLYGRSKLAWKVATYQQAILYRVVALSRGARDSWNARNLPVCFLAVRALVETLAVFDDLVRVLLAHAEKKDLEQIDKLIMNRIFATRDEKLLEGRPEHQAIGVLSFIDKLEKRYGLPIRGNYDTLSERCHPNSAGHHQMYSTTDYSDGTVTFSESKNLSMNIDLVRAPLGLVVLFERSMNQLDQAIQTIGEIQHRIRPVR